MGAYGENLLKTEKGIPIDKFTRLKVLNTIFKTGLIPLFYSDDFDTAKNIVKACTDAGATVIEFTNRGEHALDVFKELKKFAEKTPELMLGIGSIVEPYTAAIYIAQGADFIVGPVLNDDIAKLCNRRKIAYIPGCATLTEIQKAEELGCEIIKIFPADSIGGPAFIKSVKAPCPWVSLMPTGGVDPTEESLKEWFSAGASCVAMGSKLISQDLVNKKDFGGLKDKVAKTLDIIKKVRK